MTLLLILLLYKPSGNMSILESVAVHTGPEIIES
jgi:hypothetical protein